MGAMGAVGGDIGTSQLLLLVIGTVRQELQELSRSKEMQDNSKWELRYIEN